MKGMGVTDWRAVQVFLSQDSFGIFEVEVKEDNSDVRCNCTTYGIKNSCKHSRFVRRRMDANQGRYATPIADHVDTNDKEVQKSMVEFLNKEKSANRAFLLKYGKVEVI